MKRFFSVAALWSLAAVVHPADFRSASWGMTMTEVKALHPGELSANQWRFRIEYDAKLGDLNVLIFYSFDDLGGLHQAGYKSNEDHADDISHIADYQTLNELLRRKYPQSSTPVQQWQNRMFESKPEQWGRAIALGHLTYRWTYSVERTNILHLLDGDRRDMNHVVQYEVIAQTSDAVLDEL